ncbi:MAG: tetratricopeptide repeat protein [Pelobacteraceae bacterium]
MPPRAGSERIAVVAASAAVICLLVFLRSLSCGFVNLDDYEYVLNNPLLRQLDAGAIVDAFTKPHAGFWMPLTWISLALDYHFWGLNPLGYHLTNIVLHAVNTGLVVLIADRVLAKGHVTGSKRGVSDAKATSLNPPLSGGKLFTPPLIRRGWEGLGYPVTLMLAGLLWGIHPLRVESVAWVTERKDVLNGLFAFSSVLCYLRYARLRESGEAFRACYLLALFLFACSLMAKQVTVVLPLVLLALDWYWERVERAGVFNLLIEKIPFILVSGAMAAITLHFAKQSGILLPHDTLPFVQRLLISGNALFEYCRLMVYPAGIMPLHIIDLSEMATYGAKTAVVVTACIVLCVFRNRSGVVVTALCFLLPLLPVLAIFQNGLQAFAARFTYLSAVAPAILLCSVFAPSFRRGGENGRRWGLGVAVLFLVAVTVVFAVATFRQIAVWKSTETVWTRIIEVKPSGRAYKERGMYRLANGNYAAAADDLALSLEFARRADLPEMFNLHAFRGEALRQQQRYGEALDEFTRAIAVCPRREYYFRRGVVLEGLGRKEAALEDFRRAGGVEEPMKWLERGACD